MSMFFRALCLAALLTTHTLPVSAACTCPRPNPTLEDLIESPENLAVFAGRVVSITTPEGGGPRVVRIAVDDIIKGDVPRVVEMSGVTLRDNPCGVDFRPGEARTLAVKREDGRWVTSMCLVPRL